MTYKLIILLAYIWIMVYNISYIIYEFKCKNSLAAWGVVALMTVITLAVSGTVFFA